MCRESRLVAATSRDCFASLHTAWLHSKVPAAHTSAGALETQLVPGAEAQPLGQQVHPVPGDAPPVLVQQAARVHAVGVPHCNAKTTDILTTA